MTPVEFIENTCSGWISVAIAERAHIEVAVWHVVCGAWKWVAFHVFTVFVYLIQKGSGR